MIPRIVRTIQMMIMTLINRAMKCRSSDVWRVNPKP